MQNLLLVGDIGGTYTRLAIAQENNRHVKLMRQKKYEGRQFASFYAVLDQFLQDTQLSTHELYGTCFAVAGAIQNGALNFTNLDWHVSETKLSQQLKLDPVKLINDFQAIGYSLDVLETNDTLLLKQGSAIAHAPQLIVGAGTGLGVGLITRHNHEIVLLPSEGGHLDFAPTNETQIELLRFLLGRHKRVSFERLVSGMGLDNIYHFFQHKENPKQPLLNTANKEIAGKVVLERALIAKEPLAIKTVELFRDIYASVIGSLGLITLPYGGIYIAGGIAPRILPFMQAPEFYANYINKGRMSHLLEDIPIYMITQRHVGLMGAAHYAMMSRPPK